MSAERHPRLLPVAEEARVTPIELFFDLVFVFSLTQVTALMSDDPTGRGVLRGLLVLALLWWCWVGYAWLGNVVQAEEGLGRAAMFSAMAAMFVMALAVPEAFDDRPGGLAGPVVVAFAYLAVRLLHLAIFWLAARSEHDRALRRQLLLFMPTLFGSTALLLVASQLHGTTQTLTWVSVLIVDYVGVILGGASGWRLRSASHFAERHGLIVIVALGESIVAIGVGVAHIPISAPILAAAVLGLAVAACLWWAYFDVVSIVAECALRRLDGEERARMARDAYSYLHLPMVAGIALLALGIEKVLANVGQTINGELSEPLAALPLAALYGGVALFLFAHVAFKYRTWGQVTIRRLVVALVICLLIPLASQLPALAALGLLTAVMVSMIASEAIRYTECANRSATTTPALRFTTHIEGTQPLRTRRSHARLRGNFQMLAASMPRRKRAARPSASLSPKPATPPSHGRSSRNGSEPRSRPSRGVCSWDRCRYRGPHHLILDMDRPWVRPDPTGRSAWPPRSSRDRPRSSVLPR